MIGSEPRWMAAAADVLRALNADEPRDALLGRVARHTCELVRVERCSVMLLDDGGERLVVRAGRTGTDPRETEGVFELQVALMVRDVQRAAGN